MERQPDNPVADQRAFPRLSEEEIQQIERFGQVESLPSGTTIFERGERSVDFFVVLKGRVEIFDDGTVEENDEPRVVHVHMEHGFTGELDLFSSRKILVNGRVVTEDGSDAEVLRVPRDQFSRMLSAEPQVGEIVMRAFIHRRLDLIQTASGGVLMIGQRNSPATLELRRFLRRNGYPLRLLYIDDEKEGEAANREIQERGYCEDELPIVVCSPQHTLCRPSVAQVAECLGLTEQHDPDQVYDVTVVGAGPAGLAAAVYAASEGLKTLILEAQALGGQAGTSSRIENYLGFPTGLSGEELAGRGQAQAQKFGATLSLPRQAKGLELHNGMYRVELDQGPAVTTRTVVVACGARWRTLDIENCDRFTGSGIHYAATTVEADLCKDKQVVVIGGGNSAGQAAVYLSRHAKCVHMLIRGDSLADSMSDYLLQRIELSDRIKLHTNTKVTALDGDDWLSQVTWQHGGDKPTEQDVSNLFLMIGAEPNTDWLDGTVRLDRGGFICTGSNAMGEADEGASDAHPWSLERDPHTYESSLPGVFAAGDIRSGSVKRVASAVGEGSVCVQALHRVIHEQQRDVVPVNR
jgi:thioredoxin reductase (NADPH)